MFYKEIQGGPGATITENVLTGGVSPDMQWHKLIRT